jgi:hypothetical protein
MSVEPAFGILDPALKRDDGPAARNYLAGDVHDAGIGPYRADNLAVVSCDGQVSPSESVVWAASAMAVSSIVMIQPPWTVLVRLQKRGSGVARTARPCHPPAEAG